MKRLLLVSVLFSASVFAQESDRKDPIIYKSEQSSPDAPVVYSQFPVRGSNKVEKIDKKGLVIVDEQNLIREYEKNQNVESLYGQDLDEVKPNQLLVIKEEFTRAQKCRIARKNIKTLNDQSDVYKLDEKGKSELIEEKDLRKYKKQTLQQINDFCSVS